MKRLSVKIRIPTFKQFTGLATLEMQVQKFRELRDSYREANKKYYGKYLASLLDD